MALTLSIIVPVFNVERYLTKCLDSLLSQDIDLDAYEIILIDDGSTDDGGEMCDGFASKHKNIIAVHQINQGLSVARNTGLRMARGRFVMFVDSDDFIQEGVLAALIREMEEFELDILRFRLRRIREEDITYPEVQGQHYSSSKLDVYNGHDFLFNRLGKGCYACQFMINKDYLIQNDLYFSPGIIFEDTEWTPRVLEKAKRVAETDVLVYNYLEREGSITQGRVERVVQGQMKLIHLLKGQMELLEDKRWYEGMIAHIVVTIITQIGNNLYSQRNKYLTRLSNENIYPLSLYSASKSATRKIRLINLSPRLACSAIHFANL
jgi:glycosyltransferase involved in cell wall biosynthesis